MWKALRPCETQFIVFGGAQLRFLGMLEKCRLIRTGEVQCCLEPLTGDVECEIIFAKTLPVLESFINARLAKKMDADGETRMNRVLWRGELAVREGGETIACKTKEDIYGLCIA